MINDNQIQRSDNRVGDDGNDQKDFSDVVRKQRNYNIIIKLCWNIRHVGCKYEVSGIL